MQCLAIKRSIEAIRKISPDAALITTEDIGKTFATEPLQYQADHENERRWLTFDLIAGRVVPGHPFYSWLRNKAASEEELAELATGAAAPTMIGFDHYVTSERYLDHRTERYSDVKPGSNGRDEYVDVEAVRIAKLTKSLGPRLRLHETWARYRIPIAVTEVHHGCTRDEQVRWLHQVWTKRLPPKRKGSTSERSRYGRCSEWSTGVRCLRGAKASTMSVLSMPAPKRSGRLSCEDRGSSGTRRNHRPSRARPAGWWRRPGRTHARPRYDMLPRCSTRNARPILITGATGTLGQAFAKICAHRGLKHVLTSRADVDITDENSIAAAIVRHRPWAVINAAGFVRTWEADQKFDECLAINATGPELLGKACKAAGIPLVTFSSDLVFDGKLGRPYLEPDAPAPACAYGKSKAEAEQQLMAIIPTPSLSGRVPSLALGTATISW